VLEETRGMRCKQTVVGGFWCMFCSSRLHGKGSSCSSLMTDMTELVPFCAAALLCVGVYPCSKSRASTMTRRRSR
jgi:hypothetical protein